MGGCGFGRVRGREGWGGGRRDDGRVERGLEPAGRAWRGAEAHRVHVGPPGPRVLLRQVLAQRCPVPDSPKASMQAGSVLYRLRLRAARAPAHVGPAQSGSGRSAARPGPSALRPAKTGQPRSGHDGCGGIGVVVGPGAGAAGRAGAEHGPAGSAGHRGSAGGCGVGSGAVDAGGHDRAGAGPGQVAGRDDRGGRAGVQHCPRLRSAEAGSLRRWSCCGAGWR